MKVMIKYRDSGEFEVSVLNPITGMTRRYYTLDQLKIVDQELYESAKKMVASNEPIEVDVWS